MRKAVARIEGFSHSVIFNDTKSSAAACPDSPLPILPNGANWPFGDARYFNHFSLLDPAETAVAAGPKPAGAINENRPGAICEGQTVLSIEDLLNFVFSDKCDSC